MAEWRIFARDVANARQFEVRDYLSLSARLDFNAAGAWTLEVPDSADVRRVLDFRGGLVVTRDGVTVFSGGIRHRERDVVFGSHDRWRLAGPSDTGALVRNLVYPVADGPPFTAAAYATKSGPAENIMREYCRETVGETADPERQINGFSSGVDGGIGLTVTKSPRFDNLLEVLQEIAVEGAYDESNPLYFRVLQNQTNPSVLDFLVTVPVDRSRDVVFARDRKNLLGYSEKETAPGANYLIVGGKGELEQQVLPVFGLSPSINRYGRTEGFVNKTNLDAAVDLSNVGLTELNKALPKSAVEISTIDTESTQAFVHYGVGDRVTVILDGSARTGIVRELGVTINRRDLATVTPLVVLDGTPL
jgi:hypothetical protein